MCNIVLNKIETVFTRQLNYIWFERDNAAGRIFYLSESHDSDQQMCYVREMIVWSDGIIKWILYKLFSFFMYQGRRLPNQNRIHFMFASLNIHAKVI